MPRLATAITGRPKAALLVWGLVVAILAGIGARVKDDLALTRIAIPGTESAHEVDLAGATFGRAATFPVMLHGPRAVLDREGPRAVAALRRQDGVRAVSPFDAPGTSPLRPRPQDALVVLSWHLRDGEQPYDVVDRVRATVERAVPPRLHPQITGPTVIGKGLNDASLDAVAKAELVAAPMLLIVLLLLFRTPVAASIPLIVGGATVACGNGIIALLAKVVELDVLAATAGALLGLALGVDYSLLMVARFREVRAELGDVGAARHAVATALSAGRTVLFAGVVLVVAMGVGLILSPGPVIVSGAVGTIAVGVAAVASATVAVPALLVLLAPHVDRWPIGRRGADGTRAATRAGATGIVAVARGAQRRPLLFGAAAAVPLLALTAVGLTFDGGAPTWRQLPSGNPVRANVERLRTLYGTGWEAPVEIVLTARSGRPITDRATLRTLDRLEGRIAKDRAVGLVAGPAEVRSALARLEDLPRALGSLGLTGGSGRRQLDGIAHRLDAARGSLDGLDGKLAAAVAASTRIQDGSLALRSGATQLGRGARRVQGGTGRVRDGLGEALAGARRLDAALTRALAGARTLTAAAGDLRDGTRSLRAGAGAQLGRGARALQAGLDDGATRLSALQQPASDAVAAARRSYAALTAMSVGKADPRYREAAEAAGETLAALSGRDPRDDRPVADGYDGLPAALETAAARTRDAAAAAGRLASGAGDVAAAAARLEGGIGRLAAGQDRLRAALDAIAEGAPQGQAGLARLRAASTDLDAGLAALVGGSDRLRAGLDRVAAGSARLRDRLADESRRALPLLRRAASSDGAIGRLRRAAGATAGLERSPGLLSSGYVALAALDGAKAADRNRSSLFVDVLGGGRAARILVVPAVAPNTAASRALRDRLSNLVAALPVSQISDGAVGGVGAELEDFTARTRGGFPLLLAGISLASVLALMLLLRAVLLPLIAVSLNLLTVGVAFGVLVLGFEGEHPALGGPGYIDMVGVVVLFVVIFALSIDYQVFLLARMREGLDRTGDPRGAIAHAIERTAPVVTGAAVIMCAVFLAFASSDLTLLRQLGVGLTVAVLVDATVVRLVLLPAILQAVGGAAWWFPPRVGRRLPAFAVD